MTIAHGTRLGAYEIDALVGAGGMGEVYRALDTKLGRSVAIKVLPESVAHDRERIARFEREAKSLAALNHPHIATLHGLEEHAGRHFLVMELVDGETLAERLRHGPLPIDEALRVARQIAEALEAAHERGIVHRDLKPANVKLTPDDQVKVLDFGLAKAMDSVQSGDVANSPTLSVMATAAGAILGTAAYMSPEQARGKPIDKRSDIWSFGCVVYELLTRRAPFAGDTVSDIIAAILTRPPDWTRLPETTPAHVRHLLERCLEKDPKQRLRDIGDGRLELQAGTGSQQAAASPAAVRRRRITPPIAAAAGALAGAVVTALAIQTWAGAGRSPNAEVARLQLSIAPAEHLQATPADRTTNEGRPSRTAMTWSPDGRALVFSAVRGTTQQLFLRRMDALAAVAIAETEGGSDPFFSPDSRWIGFWSGNTLKKVPVGGGPATAICATPPIFGASWGSDDAIVFSVGREGLQRVSASGGAPQALAKPDLAKGELKFHLPRVLPGSKAVLYTMMRTTFPRWDDTDVVVQSLESGPPKVLITGAADARYMPPGYLLYLRRGTLMAAPFDAGRLEITGGEVALASDVMQAANMTNENYDSGAGQFSVSDSGSLAYLPGGVFPDPVRQLVWVDRTGTIDPVPLTPRALLSPRLSPDSERVLFWTQGDRNVWVYHLARRTVTRVTTEGRNARAIWTPAGRRVAYGSAITGDEQIVWKDVDGTSAPESIIKGLQVHAPAVWTSDGKTLILVVGGPAAGVGRILGLDLEGDRTPRPLVGSRFIESHPDLSPDGRWLAYASNESGSTEVYVQPFPGPGPRHQVSIDGGSAPAWSHDGRELFYTTAQTVGGQAALTSMMTVPVTLGEKFSAGTARVLFRGRFGATALTRAYDVSRDGKRFLMVQQQERPILPVSEMVIVQNWVEELKRRTTR